MSQANLTVWRWRTLRSYFGKSNWYSPIRNRLDGFSHPNILWLAVEKLSYSEFGYNYDLWILIQKDGLWPGADSRIGTSLIISRLMIRGCTLCSAVGNYCETSVKRSYRRESMVIHMDDSPLETPMRTFPTNSLSNRRAINSKMRSWVKLYPRPLRWRGRYVLWVARRLSSILFLTWFSCSFLERLNKFGSANPPSRIRVCLPVLIPLSILRLVAYGFCLRYYFPAFSYLYVL